jgi:hypothetical protein
MPHPVTLSAEISISPRHTWIWVDSLEHAERLRALLDTLTVSWSPARNGHGHHPTATSIPAGRETFTALTALHTQGYRLQWHRSQSFHNRATHLNGIPVSR